MIFIAWLATALAWEELGPGGTSTGRTLDPHALFAPELPSWYAADVVTSPADLALVASNTADTLRRLRAEGSPLATVGVLGELGVTLEDVLQTLDLVARTAWEDRGQHPQRLQDPAWIAAHGAWETPSAVR